MFPGTDSHSVENEFMSQKMHHTYPETHTHMPTACNILSIFHFLSLRFLAISIGLNSHILYRISTAMDNSIFIKLKFPQVSKRKLLQTSQSFMISFLPNNCPNKTCEIQFSLGIAVGSKAISGFLLFVIRGIWKNLSAKRYLVFSIEILSKLG